MKSFDFKMIIKCIHDKFFSYNNEKWTSQVTWYPNASCTNWLLVISLQTFHHTVHPITSIHCVYILPHPWALSQLGKTVKPDNIHINIRTVLITTEWERLEISSRKLGIPREHFMQTWAKIRNRESNLVNYAITNF